MYFRLFLICLFVCLFIFTDLYSKAYFMYTTNAYLGFLFLLIIIIIIITYLIWEFFPPALADGFPLESEYKYRQVSRTLLCILADLNKAVLWMVSTHLIIYKSSSPWTNPLVTIPNTLIAIDITFTFMFQSFFNSLARSTYLSLFSLFYPVVSRTAKSTIRQILIFFSFLFLFFFPFFVCFVDYHEVWSSGRD